METHLVELIRQSRIQLDRSRKIAFCLGLIAHGLIGQPHVHMVFSIFRIRLDQFFEYQNGLMKIAFHRIYIAQVQEKAGLRITEFVASGLQIIECLIIIPEQPTMDFPQQLRSLPVPRLTGQGFVEIQSRQFPLIQTGIYETECVQAGNKVRIDLETLF